MKENLDKDVHKDKEKADAASFNSKENDSSDEALTQQKKDAILKEMIEAPVSIDEIDSLKELTDTQEIEIASGDLAAHVRSYESTLRGRKKDTYYHNIIFALVQIRLPEEEAKKDWNDILKHKYTMSEKLGRNVGIHVATLDYYTSIKRYVRRPKIIDANEYVDTASHAITDELTKTYNRRFFNGELDRLFKYADAFKTTFSLLMLDMDYFKNYNDINGHIKGDIALIESVRIFHAVCGSKATVCRYGGEEFAILLPERPLEKAVSIAGNIRGAIYDYRFVNEQLLPKNRLTVSCGVVEFRKDFSSAKDMLDQADKALYRAKNNGRNRVVYVPHTQE